MNDLRDLEGAADICERIIRAIEPLLRGYHPVIQSAVLADLTASWLAGHIVVGDDRPGATDLHREQLLAEHIALIRTLIPVLEAENAARVAAAAGPIKPGSHVIWDEDGEMIVKRLDPDEPTQ